LREEIAAERLNVRVFTVNNHYLCHLQYIIIKAGCLKAYSCRNLERTIKKYSNLIKSKTKINSSASNVLTSQAGYNSHFVRSITQSLVPKPIYSPNSFWCHPSGIPHYPQLWEPFIEDTLSDELYADLSCCDVPKHKIVKALKKFYARTTGDTDVDVDELNLGIAAKAWKDSKQYSSVFDRKCKNLHTRAGNIVMFDVNTGRRYVLFFFFTSISLGFNIKSIVGLEMLGLLVRYSAILSINRTIKLVF
jgi:hypothetical protein